jgi:hypothetical protein
VNVAAVLPMFLFASNFSRLEVNFIIPDRKHTNAAIPATIQYALLIFTLLKSK